MKWALLVVLIGANLNKSFQPAHFASETGCIAAAQEFVREYPGFEWHDHRISQFPFEIIDGSYVKCILVGGNGGRERDHEQDASPKT